MQSLYDVRKSHRREGLHILLEQTSVCVGAECDGLLVDIRIESPEATGERQSYDGDALGICTLRQMHLCYCHV